MPNIIPFHRLFVLGGLIVALLLGRKVQQWIIAVGEQQKPYMKLSQNEDMDGSSPSTLMELTDMS